MEIVKGGEDRITFLDIAPTEIIAHTHVDGGVTPSEFDMQMMKRLNQSSTIIIDAVTGEAKSVKART